MYQGIWILLKLYLDTDTDTFKVYLDTDMDVFQVYLDTDIDTEFNETISSYRFGYCKNKSIWKQSGYGYLFAQVWSPDMYTDAAGPMKLTFRTIASVYTIHLMLSGKTNSAISVQILQRGNRKIIERNSDGLMFNGVETGFMSRAQ